MSFFHQNIDALEATDLCFRWVTMKLKWGIMPHKNCGNLPLFS
jgi:hypothetical protein